MKQVAENKKVPNTVVKKKGSPFFCSSIANQRAFFQSKLTVGPTNDIYEKEADAVAEKVMRMEDPGVVQPKPAISSVQRTCAECAQEEENEVQPNSSRTSQTDAPSLVHNVVSSGSGSRMDDGHRSVMENNFGYDFSNVRIHTGTIATKSAQSINALAYTSGNDIIFNQGQYAPETNTGKKLLAHELTHVIQQKGHSKQTISPVQRNCPVHQTNETNNIQRAVKVDPAVDLDTMGFHVVRTGDTYTSNDVTKSSVWNEIISSIFFSPRIFKVKGSTSGEANRNFKAHLKSRYDIITFASKKKYRFGAGGAFTMNPEFWVVDHEHGTFDFKPGANQQKAREDLIAHPEEYVIACEAATKITMEGGSKSSLRGDYGNADDEWIPGDWGWIKNINHQDDGMPGRDGENIIYVGQDLYWGHNSGEAYRTLEQWLAMVNSWNNNGAQIQGWRNYPIKGLE